MPPFILELPQPLALWLQGLALGILPPCGHISWFPTTRGVPWKGLLVCVCLFCMTVLWLWVRVASLKVKLCCSCCSAVVRSCTPDTEGGGG